MCKFFLGFVILVLCVNYQFSIFFNFECQWNTDEVRQERLGLTAVLLTRGPDTTLITVLLIAIMETRSTKMSLIKPTLIKPTQIRSALFSNLHFYYCANIACKGLHLPIREEMMRMIQKKPHVGPWREKYPRLRLNKKKGFPPDFPVPYLLPGSCISHSAKHLLLTHNSIYILYLVSCVFCYVLSVYSSILLTNCSPPPPRCM